MTPLADGPVFYLFFIVLIQGRLLDLHADAYKSALLQCFEVCVLMQYMVVYQLFTSIASNVIFALQGAGFSVIQVHITHSPCTAAFVRLLCTGIELKHCQLAFDRPQDSKYECLLLY